MSLSYDTYIYISQTSDAFTPAYPRRILRLASHATTLFYRQRRHAKRALSPSRHVARRITSDGYDGNLRFWTLEKQSLRLLHEVDVDVAADSASPIFSVALEALGDGQLMLAAGSYCRRLRVWHCDSISASPQLRWHSAQHTGWVRSLAVDSRQGSPSALYSIGCNFVLGWSLPKVSPSGAPCTRDGQIAIYEDEQHVFSHDVLCLAQGTPRKPSPPEVWTAPCVYGVRASCMADLPSCPSVEVRIGLGTKAV